MTQTPPSAMMRRICSVARALLADAESDANPRRGDENAVSFRARARVMASLLAEPEVDAWIAITGGWKDGEAPPGGAKG